MRMPALHLLSAMLFCLVLSVSLYAEDNMGQKIYRESCASCHGDDGQGKVDEYEEPLRGDHSLAALTRLIELTMPEGDPKACVGDDAAQVAQYIFAEFYSPAARLEKGLDERPRVELLRLNVPQYRNAVADLLLRFTPAVRTGRRDRDDDQGEYEIEPGLRAEYFQSNGMNKADAKKDERTDTKIDFDFGTGSPKDDIAADQFAIIWEGSVAIEETGHYEFKVASPNGVRLYLNVDPSGRRGKLRDDSSAAGQTALIDAWVSSGKMRESTARVYLLGGRTYSVRLEFFKYKEESSSVRLEWKVPHGVWRVIDGRHLSTARSPRTYVCDTAFPADDRSLGYERGSSVSHEWITAVTNAASATAEEVVSRLPLLVGQVDNESQQMEKAQQFVLQFASVAFRRPLTAEEKNMLTQQFFADASDPDAALRRAVILVMTSPHFLYADLNADAKQVDSFAVANRLALTLWDSIPDETLWQAAEKDELQTEQQVREQAERMLQHSLAKQKIRRFFHHWLELGERDVAKDNQLFPEFDEDVAFDLRTSLVHFVDDIVWSDASDYRQLLLADYLLLNDRLNSLYGAPEALNDASDNSGEFQQVSVGKDGRSGVLTHPYLLSAFAYHNNTSPIHRGVFLTRNIVGRGLKPPPIAVAFKNDEFASDLTMREKVTQLTRDSACMACHSLINPLGFALENYDAIGRRREQDNQKPVNTTSDYVTSTGETMEVTSAKDIAVFAANDEAAHRSFVRQLFQHMVSQNSYAYGSESMETLRNHFQNDQFNIQKLMVRIATQTARFAEADTSSDGEPVAAK